VALSKESVSGQLPRRLVVVLAVATGVAVASNYYAQPLLAVIRHSLHVGSGEAGLIVTASQVGYALGLVFLLPLGDLVERKRLVLVMSVVTAVALVGAASSPDLGVLFAMAAIVGANSVLAQVLVSFTASLASDEQRGRMVGTVMSGLLLGILLARTVAGYIAQASSWRVVYLVAAGLMLAVAATLGRVLPRYREQSGLSYPGILVSVVRIFRSEPVLRWRSVFGLLSFAAFSVLWTSLAFLLSGAPYHYASGTIGLFGLVGAAGAAMASLAGRLADRGHQRAVTVATAAAILFAFLILWGDPSSLVALVAGIVVLDLGCQGIHISNQSQIYRLAAEARSRVNAAYMTCYFIGGTLGSVGSALCFQDFGWDGVCGLGTAVGGLLFVLTLAERRLSARSGAGPQPPATAGTTLSV
jgi:predicted MFS family arabinose efflux permease